MEFFQPRTYIEEAGSEFFQVLEPRRKLGIFPSPRNIKKCEEIRRIYEEKMKEIRRIYDKRMKEI